MEYLYIKFEVPAAVPAKKQPRAEGFFQKIIIKILSTFIPVANPDFKEIFDNVAEWLVEINSDNKRPEREIGLDKDGQTILIMPWRANYGFWLDTNITLDHFRVNFKAIDIDKINFETKWNAFIKQNSLSEISST